MAPTLPLVLVLVSLMTFAALTASAEPTCDPNAHANPSRGEIFDAMVSAAPAVRACVPTRGQVEVRVEFFCDGSVSQATVPEAAPLTAEERACIVRALSTARIQPFSQARFSVSFPFSVGR